MNSESTIEIDSNLTAKITYHDNVDQSLIRISEDKMWRILKDHIENVESKKAWQAPLGILISLILIPVTTDKFTDFIIPARWWQEVVGVLIVCSTIWLIYTGRKCWKARKTSIESIIDAMKKKEPDINKAVNPGELIEMHDGKNNFRNDT